LLSAPDRNPEMGEGFDSEEPAVEEDPERDLPISSLDYERIDLREPLVSRLIGQASKEERLRWFDEKFPRIDRQLENGMPVHAILKRFQETVYQTSKHDPTSKPDAVNDLRIVSAYIEHQLQHPDSRLRHENERYRNYATMLEQAASMSEVINAASAIRLENARVGLAWKDLSSAERQNIPRPLTTREMQFLFTEVSPSHYSSDMTVARLAYSHSGTSRRTTAEALVRGEIAPSQEAIKLIDSLTSRLDRRFAKDAIGATKHFLESLRTPNEELRHKNAFDHKEIYSKLPPPEKDFVYQRAVQQKERLQTVASIRQEVKQDLINLFQNRSAIKGDGLVGQASLVIERHLNRVDSTGERKGDLEIVGHEIGERIKKELRSIERDQGRAVADRPHLNGFADTGRHYDNAPPLHQPSKARFIEHEHSR
jgi:hypothetical protein